MNKHLYNYEFESEELKAKTKAFMNQEIRGGLLGAVRAQMTVEEHGGGKQLVRFRTRATIYPMGLTLILLFAFLSLSALLDQVWPVAVLLFAASVGLMIDFLRHCGVATGVCKKVFLDQDLPIKVDVEQAKKIRR